MFQNIKFTKWIAANRLSEKNVTEEYLSANIKNKENLLHSKFIINGTAEHFLSPPITEFAAQNLFHMEGFTLFHYGFGSFTERKNYQSFLILYTYSGQGQLTYQGKKSILSEGDGAFINCSEYHLYKTIGNQWDVCALHINGPLLDAFYTQYMQNGSALFHEELSGDFQLLLEKLLRLYDTPQLYRDWQTSTCIDNILNHLLLLNMQNVKNPDVSDNIGYMIKYLHHNYTQHLTLDYLAKFACMNKFYFAKEFKKYTGFSPNDYIITLRINKAKELLKSTSYPAIKIAHEVGIHDINNFTNLFKKKVGMTPIQYRQSNSSF